jgi:hypothetical protein
MSDTYKMRGGVTLEEVAYRKLKTGEKSESKVSGVRREVVIKQRKGRAGGLVKGFCAREIRIWEITMQNCMTSRHSRGNCLPWASGKPRAVGQTPCDHGLKQMKGGISPLLDLISREETKGRIINQDT